MLRFSPNEFLEVLKSAVEQTALNGDFESSKRYLEGGLRLVKRVYGPSHPNYALWLIHAGDIASSCKDFERAKTAYREAIDILKVSLKADHLSVGIAEKNLSEILRQQGGDEKYAALLSAEADDIFQTYSKMGRGS